MKNGNIIGILNSATTTGATGIWGLQENQGNRSKNAWPRLWDNPANQFKTVSRSPLDIFAWCGGAPKAACTVTRDTTVTDSPFGGVPLKMVVTGTDPAIASYTTNVGGPWNLATAANGQTWEVRVLAKASVNTSIQIFIFGSNSGGTWSGLAGTVGDGTRSITTSWQEYTYTYTFANAGVQAVQVRLDGPDFGGAGVSIWLDGLQLYRIG
jgi:hypothetical protein